MPKLREWLSEMIAIEALQEWQSMRHVKKVGLQLSIHNENYEISQQAKG